MAVHEKMQYFTGFDVWPHVLLSVESSEGPSLSISFFSLLGHAHGSSYFDICLISGSHVESE